MAGGIVATNEVAGTTVSGGVELDTELLTSFTMVNLALANDAGVICALKRRVADVQNHNEVDLVAALSDEENLALVDTASDEAIDSILHEMGLQDG
jgi:hypothetical protein